MRVIHFCRSQSRLLASQNSAIAVMELVKHPANAA